MDKVKSVASRLASVATSGSSNGDGTAKKETRPLPERKIEDYTPFGMVLHELLEARGMSQSELGRRMREEGDPRKNPRVAVNAAMMHGEGITFSLMQYICDALKDLSHDEELKLWQAARETKRRDHEDEDE